jgi:hypothetical protein
MGKNRAKKRLSDGGGDDEENAALLGGDAGEVFDEPVSIARDSAYQS